MPPCWGSSHPVWPNMTQGKRSPAFLAPHTVTASCHGLLCPWHPPGGQGCASCTPGPILLLALAPISQPHFCTFSAGQKGYFCQALWGDRSQFPVFASTCPGDVSWQVVPSWAGGGQWGRGSHKMLQHLFLAEYSQCTAKTQGCCWGWVLGSHCIAESFSHQWNAPSTPKSPSHPPRRFLQGPVTRPKDAGTD